MRTHIAQDPDDFKRVIDDRVFKETFGEIMGDRLKRVPPEFKEVFEVQPYVANKQWYYHADIGPEVIVSDDLPDTLMEYHSAGQGVAGYLREALG